MLPDFVDDAKDALGMEAGQLPSFGAVLPELKQFDRVGCTDGTGNAMMNGFRGSGYATRGVGSRNDGVQDIWELIVEMIEGGVRGGVGLQRLPLGEMICLYVAH
jgi:hypothetical protein